MSSLRERAVSAAKNVWDKVTLGGWLRQAEQHRGLAIDVYGDEAHARAPAAYEEVYRVRLYQAMEAVAFLGLVGWLTLK